MVRTAGVPESCSRAPRRAGHASPVLHENLTWSPPAGDGVVALSLQGLSRPARVRVAVQASEVEGDGHRACRAAGPLSLLCALRPSKGQTSQPAPHWVATVHPGQAQGPRGRSKVLAPSSARAALAPAVPRRPTGGTSQMSKTLRWKATAAGRGVESGGPGGA